MKTEPIQKVTLPGGQFALHKIPTPSGAIASAWFDASGVLIDAEARSASRQSSRSVKRGGPAWQECQKWGRVFAP